MKVSLFVFILLTLLGPLWLLLSGSVDFEADYHTANRASAQLAPDPQKTTEAVIQVYSAPAFNWRKLFAVHTWIAVKPKAATQYRVYQVLGWRLAAGLPSLMDEKDLPDRYWFNEKPKVLLDLRGKKAEKLLPQITRAVASYPYPNDYEMWPGPNSNTFIAYLARQVPGLGLTMPANALGKDYLPQHAFFAPAPSGTGYQFSFFGLFGVLLAYREGFELNFLGVVYGLSPSQLALKLPGVGDLQFNLSRLLA
jgi:hypothetical protein